MTPDQALRLLSVEEWPPPLEHWPPKQKDRWKPGMHLVGRIESVMTLPRPDGSPRAGEPYTALYVRRQSDKRLVMFHGWHTAATDLDGMHPAPGLLFAAVYRGSRVKPGGKGNAFEDFKFIVAPFDEVQPAAARPSQARQETGQAQRPRSAPAPEGEATAAASPSGSNRIDPARVTSVGIARALIKGQPDEWRAAFQRFAAEARDSGELATLSELDGYRKLIARADAALTTGEAA